MKYVGQSVRSLDADEKVTGTAVYTADLTVPGMKFAKLICSPFAHARIDGFDLEAARKVEGVRTIVTHDTLDRSRLGCIRAIKPYGQAVKDRPVLAHQKVRFQGEPVAIVVADSETAAAEAVARIQVHYTPLPQVAEMKSALEGGTLVHDADAAYDRVGADDFEYDYGHNSCGGTHFVQGTPSRRFARAPTSSRTGSRFRRCSTIPWNPTAPSPWWTTSPSPCTPPRRHPFRCGTSWRACSVWRTSR